MAKRIMIKRELVKEKPNCEALYKETFSDNTSFIVLLSWFFDGNPNVMCFDNTKQNIIDNLIRG